MKLGEALSQRSDLQKRTTEMLGRLSASARSEVDIAPLEDPEALLAETQALFDQMEGLIARINRTNSRSLVATGQSITSALATRDVLKLRISALKHLLDAATGSGDWRYHSMGEAKTAPTVNVPKLRKMLDDASHRFRDLDTAIQAANWTTDLTE